MIDIIPFILTFMLSIVVGGTILKLSTKMATDRNMSWKNAFIIYAIMMVIMIMLSVVLSSLIGTQYNIFAL